MPPWTGIVLALAEPPDDRMGSRVATHLHPLAGRPLAWHVVSALAGLHPAPSAIVVVADRELNTDPFLDVCPELRVVGPGEESPWSAVQASGLEERVLLADARAPLLAGGIGRLLDAPGESAVLVDEAGRPAAAWLTRDEAAGVLGGGRGMGGVPAGAGRVTDAESALVVRDRAGYAAAGAAMRDRLVQRLMEGGVSFLLPGTTWVDLDVRIGRDSIVYPGVVLEGQTTVGEETVIGPGCRVVDSWIGSGVELKGWNYISHTSVRNRAILEPYVRRGFD